MEHAATAQAPGTIMVVDDTPANLRLLTALLTQHGYAVRPVPTGTLALHLVEAVAPDLILLDINLPDLRGYEVCERLKAKAQTRDIPVIFLSALDEVMDKVQAFQAGGVDYVTKPFHFEEVLVRVQTHVMLRQLQQRLQGQNAELAEKNAQLAAQNAELDAFAYTVAHDLKTPLSIITGFSTLLEADFATLPPASISETLQLIAQTGYRMANIVNALLLLASVRKVAEVPLTPLEMTTIVAEAQASLHSLLLQTQAEVRVPDQWPKAIGYAPWVQAVWVNYLSNALKYGGQPPRVELGATALGSGEAGGGTFIRFWIRDQGPGLTPEEQAKLFTEFTRLQQARTPGHGLGLSIVQRIVEKLGGRVGVASERGQGSVFSFTLPAA